MNQRLLLIVVLLAFNTAMWLAFVGKRPDAKVHPGLKPPPRPPAQPSKAVSTPVVVIRTNAFNWVQLEAEDYRTYIARLRSIGCPEQTIRDIVIADLEKLMAPRVQQIEGHKEPPKYWKPDRKELLRTLETLDKSGQKQEVDFEKREIIRELLGVDLAAERARTSGETDFYEERLTFLTPEKRSRVRMIMERANREEVALHEKSWLENDELTSEERNQLREISANKEREVAALLSPSELEQYNLWFSSSAYKVRDSFFAMEPSEEDFLAIYQVQREFDDRWGSREVESLPPAERAQYEHAQFEYEQKVREHLGEERYEEYRRSRDDDFQQLQAAAAQFGLNTGLAAEVYSFRKALEQERRRVQQMPGLSSDQRARVSDALAEEAERAVIEVMGPKPYRYYLRSGAGKWIWER